MRKFPNSLILEDNENVKQMALEAKELEEQMTSEPHKSLLYTKIERYVKRESKSIKEGYRVTSENEHLKLKNYRDDELDTRKNDLQTKLMN